MFLYMLQISIFGLFLFLISNLEQHVEAAKIVIVEDVCNELLLKEHDLMYGFGKCLQQTLLLDA
jgi:hypothetical protein